MEQKNKLYVGNLPFAVRDEDLANMFAEFGEISEAKVITDKFSGRSKGFGFVTFASEEDAAKAVEAMNAKEVEGRPLTVNVARPMAPRE
uniref:RNA-binding protein n=1 Tax=candidate division WWE3 bacterium TaxID=2053526 RepID=A0A7C4TLP5_UNCKA